MSEKKYKCLLVSDFTTDNFAGLLTNNEDSPFVESFTAPFGQVFPVLLNKNHECWSKEYDCAVVWTQAQSVVEPFNYLLNYRRINRKELLDKLDEYLSALSHIRDRVKVVFVPSWVMPSYNRGFGMLEMKASTGIAAMLMQMNVRLSEYFDNISNVFVLDAQRWIAQVGARAFSSKLWYMGKVPFSNDVFSEAVKDIKAAINGISGASRKLVIVDLDDTLWGGIAGDDGWDNLRLGGHDAIGEAYVDFQHALKSLTNRGILLGVVSKNEEKIALEAIEKHPEIVDGSRYAFHLNRWQKIFGAGSIKILFQENLATEPDIYARQLCNYLNISYKQIPQILFKKINEAALPFSSILAYIGIHFADFIRYLGWYKIIHLAKGLGLKEVFFGRPGQNLLPQMSNEDHRWLMEELRPDILRLQEMLDTDLSHWLANKY